MRAPLESFPEAQVESSEETAAGDELVEPSDSDKSAPAE
jgi:hypothetical protein